MGVAHRDGAAMGFHLRGDRVDIVDGEGRLEAVEARSRARLVALVHQAQDARRGRVARVDEIEAGRAPKNYVTGATVPMRFLQLAYRSRTILACSDGVPDLDRFSLPLLIV